MWTHIDILADVIRITTFQARVRLAQRYLEGRPARLQPERRDTSEQARSWG